VATICFEYPSTACTDLSPVLTDIDKRKNETNAPTSYIAYNDELRCQHPYLLAQA